MKPVRVEVTFTAERSVKRVDLHVRGEDLEVHAHCEADTFFEGVDTAIDKIARQMAKKKDRVQDHKVPKVG
jgi:ribosomal subunit interface protein